MDTHYPPLSPGMTCPTCVRRIPHERKPSSPKSKVVALRVPLDEHAAFTEILEQVERYVGVAEQPFSAFKALSLALALVLQDDSMRGYAQRAAA